jgi:hypothetical protein
MIVRHPDRDHVAIDELTEMNTGVVPLRDHIGDWRRWCCREARLKLLSSPQHVQVELITGAEVYVVVSPTAHDRHPARIP